MGIESCGKIPNIYTCEIHMKAKFNITLSSMMKFYQCFYELIKHQDTKIIWGKHRTKGTILVARESGQWDCKREDEDDKNVGIKEVTIKFFCIIRKYCMDFHVIGL